MIWHKYGASLIKFGCWEPLEAKNGVLGIDRAMDSALLRRKFSLGAPYYPLWLRVGAQKLNSARGWKFSVQSLKGNG